MKSLSTILLLISIFGTHFASADCTDYSSCLAQFNSAQSQISKDDLVPARAAKCFTRADLLSQMPNGGAYMGGISIDGVFRYAEGGDSEGNGVDVYEMDQSYQNEKPYFYDFNGPFANVQPTVFFGNEAISQFFSSQYHFNCELHARKTSDGNLIVTSLGLSDAPQGYQGIQSVCLTTKVMEQNPFNCLAYGKFRGKDDYLASNTDALNQLCGKANDSHAPVDCYYADNDEFLLHHADAVIQLCAGAKDKSPKECYIKSVNAGEPPLSNVDAVKNCTPKP